MVHIKQPLLLPTFALFSKDHLENFRMKGPVCQRKTFFIFYKIFRLSKFPSKGLGFPCSLHQTPGLSYKEIFPRSTIIHIAKMCMHECVAFLCRDGVDIIYILSFSRKEQEYLRNAVKSV